MKPDVPLSLQPADRLGFAQVIRYVVAPLVCLFSGFHTMSFLLGGLYSWPQTSRVLSLSLAVAILSYEFVYKEARTAASGSHHASSQGPLTVLFRYCAVPYMIGALALVVMIVMAKASA